MVDKREPDTAVNWALYLMDYVRHMRPMTEGLTRQLTDCNVSYKRPALEAIAAVWHREFHKPAVHGRHLGRWCVSRLAPTVVVHQQQCVRLREAIRDRYIFGRLFGNVLQAQSLSSGGSSMQGVLYCYRLCSSDGWLDRLFIKRRCIGAFVRALPAVMLLSIVWACGEFVGYLTGRPNTSLPQTLPDGKRLQGNRGCSRMIFKGIEICCPYCRGDLGDSAK